MEHSSVPYQGYQTSTLNNNQINIELNTGISNKQMMGITEEVGYSSNLFNNNQGYNPPSTNLINNQITPTLNAPLKEDI